MGKSFRKRYVFRLLVPGNSSSDKVNQFMRLKTAASLEDADCRDGLAPLSVGNPEHAGLHYIMVREKGFFDFRRIYVLSSWLDQLLFGSSLHVPKIAFF